MWVLLHPRHDLGGHARIARPHQPLVSRWLHVCQPCLTVTGMSLSAVTHAVAVHVARGEHDSLGVQSEVTKSALVQ